MYSIVAGADPEVGKEGALCSKKVENQKKRVTSVGDSNSSCSLSKYYPHL